MAKIYCIKCYVTRPQYEQIKQDAHVNGKRAVSDYIRSVIVGRSMMIEQKIVENNAILKRLEKHLLKTA
ncbi:hypothetical protein HY489_01825 [Candidatus Woesearchaeota archaeon]|nr:hypothetical protein [Candidatus Woesearchaeota archaeon]